MAHVGELDRRSFCSSACWRLGHRLDCSPRRPTRLLAACLVTIRRRSRITRWWALRSTSSAPANGTLGEMGLPARAARDRIGHGGPTSGGAQTPSADSAPTDPHRRATDTGFSASAGISADHPSARASKRPAGMPRPSRSCRRTARAQQGRLRVQTWRRQATAEARRCLMRDLAGVVHRAVLLDAIAA
jgi:hypothetical protein